MRLCILYLCILKLPIHHNIYIYKIQNTEFIFITVSYMYIISIHLTGQKTYYLNKSEQMS